MSLDAPRSLGYWSIRLLPPMAGALGLTGLALTSGPVAIVSALLVVFAALLEWRGWGRAAQTRGRALAVATLAGACACALGLAAVGLNGPGTDENVVARR